MHIKLLYFGMIAEWKGVSEETKMVSKDATIKNLLAEIELQIPEIKEINYALAHNQTMVEGEFKLSDGDEISLFPPFAGG